MQEVEEISSTDDPALSGGVAARDPTFSRNRQVGNNPQNPINLFGDPVATAPPVKRLKPGHSNSTHPARPTLNKQDVDWEMY